MVQNVFVRKSDKIERFDENKLINSLLNVGLQASLSVRVANEILGEILEGMNGVDTAERKDTAPKSSEIEISSKEIKSKVYEKLKNINNVMAEKYLNGNTTKVRTSLSTFEDFDVNKISKSLVEETGIDEKAAKKIAKRVEKQMRKLNIEFVTAPLIREMVCVELLKNGLERERKLYTRLGMPVYDVTFLIEHGTKENANLQFNPETIHKLMADQISKEYSLIKVLPLELADAHMRGEIHIHDLDYFALRPFCFSHDIRFFLKHGLKVDGVGNHTAVAGPAKNSEVAILHAAKVLASAQVNCAGGQGFSYFNTFLAPYVKGLPYDKVKQLAQMFIYEMSMMYVARGGQSVHHDEYVFIKKGDGLFSKFTSVKIGEFVDNYLEKHKKDVVKTGSMEILKLKDDIKTISLDPLALRFKEYNITGISRHIPADIFLYEIKTSEGRSVRVTDFHSIYTIRKGKLAKVRASELSINDVVIVPEESSKIIDSPFTIDKIVSITKVPASEYVYDLEVAPDGEHIENFLANSILVSNTVFSSIDCDMEIPEQFKSIPAVLPGGIVKENITYADFEDEVRTLFNAFVDVYLKGDFMGKAFNFPKFEVQIYPKKIDKQDDLLLKVSQLAAKFGTPYYIINQPYMPLYACYQCCSFLMPLTDANTEQDVINGTIRGGGLQVVTINLPQIAYESNRNEAIFFEILKDRMEKAKKAHLLKREIIKKNQSLGMLPFMSQIVNEKGDKYLEVDRQSFIMGLVGMNECVKFMTDYELHEDAGWKFGLRVMNKMKNIVAEIRNETGLNFSLARTPAESCSYRLAQIDSRRFPSKFIANGEGKDAYYTNSFHVRPSANVPLWKRLNVEGSFHPITDGGAMTHVWLGEQNPDPEAILSLTKKIATKTAIQYMAFTKDLTVCNKCNFVAGGLHDKCQNCNSENVEWWSRITGYYQNIKGWNKGKLRELQDRRRYGFENGDKIAAKEISFTMKEEGYEARFEKLKEKLKYDTSLDF